MSSDFWRRLPIAFMTFMRRRPRHHPLGGCPADSTPVFGVSTMPFAPGPVLCQNNFVS
jgi:hypothetical protein